jgi:hypothetical protein
MRWRVRTAVCTLIFLCALLWVAAPIAAVEGWTSPSSAAKTAAADQPQATKTKSVQAKVERWMKDLSKEEEFADWREAKYRLYPLGPGSHGWVAIVELDGEEIGYMTITSTPEGEYLLTEYGTGAYPLFSLNTLYRSLVQWGLIPDSWTVDRLEKDPSVILERLYSPPVFAVWKVHTKEAVYLFDAKTGEGYPVESEQSIIEHIPVTAIVLKGKMKGMEVDIFDPFDSLFWIDEEEPSSYTFRSLKAQLQSKLRLVYTAKILDDTITLPFAVIGLQQWGEQEPLLLIDHYGPRYLPYSTLVKAGHFHMQSGAYTAL